MTAKIQYNARVWCGFTSCADVVDLRAYPAVVVVKDLASA